jgi:metal-responsive CopG/Arc/MetJ family transcriptional regulator
MKTAISLPDALFEQADAVAATMHLSRSQLYAKALERFLKEHRDGRIAAALNAYIDASGQPVDREFLGIAPREMRTGEW